MKNHISKHTDSNRIIHINANGYHKFIIESDDPTNWLYLDEETIEDNNLSELITLIENANVCDKLNQTTSSKWFYLSASGLKEVDETFTKQ